LSPEVIVADDLEFAIKRLSKWALASGLFRELKDRQNFISKGEKKKMKMAVSAKRLRRKKMKMELGEKIYLKRGGR